ncbi:sensor histidine kinase, partial [Klebsiella pneumoniae]|nr:sensor histidine kinase [Klebsiella pneumoniae]
LDRTLALAAELPSVPLAMQLYAEENDGWLSLYLTDNVPLLQVRYAHSPDALNSPGKGMELRLIQTLVAHHRGAIELASRPQGQAGAALRS